MTTDKRVALSQYRDSSEGMATKQFWIIILFSNIIRFICVSTIFQKPTRIMW